MPPKTPTSNDDNASDPVPKASDIVTLCNLIMACDSFSADNKLVGDKIKISAKNVPRKINSIINQYGFELKNGKMHARGPDGAVPATPGATAAADEDGDLPTPASNKKATPKKKSATTPKTPRSNKKRKVDPEEDEPTADGDNVKTEVDAQEGDADDVVDTADVNDGVKAEQDDEM